MGADNVRLLKELGEPMAAGLLEYAEGPLAKTYCRGYRRYYETCAIVYEAGAPLFPAGVTERDYTAKNARGETVPMAVFPHYAHQVEYDWGHLEEKSPEAAKIMRDYTARFHYAGCWNHSVLNYKRILAEGIGGYERRLRALPESDFRDGLLDLIEGIRAYHRRALLALPALGAPEELLSALEKVPFSPAETAYEAMVSLNFCLSLDGFDNAGRLDSILAPYHRGEDLRPYLRCLMKNMQDNDRWSVTLGPDYNEITRQVIESSRGFSRPLVELRVTKEMPEWLWSLAAETAMSGGGQPSFYNEEMIQSRLLQRIPTLTKEDALEFAGGGCTETNFSGCTYSGGTDQNLNVLKVFEDYLYENLPKKATFEEFYEGFVAVLHRAQEGQMADINAYWNERAECCFAPIRSLFVDDCIDRQKGWLQGGARYTFPIHSDSGMANTVDSLLAVRHLVYREGRYSPAEFLRLLSSEDPAFFRVLATCPAYGVGDGESDALAKDLTGRFYAHYRTGRSDLGLGFFPTAHQFIRHVRHGAEVGPTPDGRHGGEPEADSVAAVQGKAQKGPTAMLQSAACYEQKDIYGIAVTNLSLSKKCSPSVLRALVEGYFSMGGMQLQITAVDRETLLDARLHPEKHGDLIVRVGGYSERFCRLTKEVQDAVLARDLFDA